MSNKVENQDGSQPVKEKVSLVLEDFRGATKLFAKNWYYTLTSYDFSKTAAHLISMDCQSDFGNAMSKDSDLSAKVSKANKNGEGSFKLAGNTGLTKVSPSMSIVRICQQLDEWRSKMLKDLYGPVDRELDTDLLHENLRDYLVEVTKRAEEIKWLTPEEAAELKEKNNEKAKEDAAKAAIEAGLTR